MPYPDSVEGFVVTSHKDWTRFTKQEFRLKTFEDRDVDIAIDGCGVCGSDVHTVTGGWGDGPLPICVGHEVIGRVVRVGKNVTTVNIGDRVGVGAQIGADVSQKLHVEVEDLHASSMHFAHAFLAHLRQLPSGSGELVRLASVASCPNMVDTYGAKWPDGTMSQGGFASHIRAHEYFTFKIPSNIETSVAAPMLCAGITTYSPLVRLGCGPGKTIAIVGLGGLGHMAVLWAVALGAEVHVISHSPSKKDDALKLGATSFICSEQENWQKPHQFKFDFILNCADATEKFDLPTYFSTMKVMGHFHTVGIGDRPLPTLGSGAFTPGGYYMGGSHIGNRPEMEAMLKLASEKGIKTWVETLDISEKACGEAVSRIKSNDVHYRFTLVGYDKVFGRRENS